MSYRNQKDPDITQTLPPFKLRPVSPDNAFDEFWVKGNANAVCQPVYQPVQGMPPEALIAPQKAEDDQIYTFRFTKHSREVVMALVGLSFMFGFFVGLSINLILLFFLDLFKVVINLLI